MRQTIYLIRVLTKAFLAAVLGAIGALVTAKAFSEEPVATHVESSSFDQYSPRAFVGEDPSIVSFEPLWAGKDEPILNDDLDETVLERWPVSVFISHPTRRRRIELPVYQFPDESPCPLRQGFVC